MFDINPDTILKRPASDSIAEMRETARSMTKARLVAVMGMFAPLYGAGPVRYEGIGPDHARTIENLIKGLTPPVADVIREEFCNLFGNPDNVRAAFAAMPRAMRESIEKVLADGFVSASVINMLCSAFLEKYEVPAKGGLKEVYVNAAALSALFQRAASGYGTAPQLTLEFGLQKYLCRVLGTGALRTDGIPQPCALPDENLRIYRNAVPFLSVAQELKDRVHDLAEINTVNEVIRPTSLRTINSMVSLPEIFPASKVKDMRNMSMRAAASLLDYWYRYPTNNEGTVTAAGLRRMINRRESPVSQLAALALPNITAQKKGMFAGVDIYRAVNRMMDYMSKCGAESEGRWLDADALALCVFVEGEDDRYLINLSELANSEFRPMIKDDSVHVGIANVMHDFTIPFIKGLMCVFASVGLVDLALDPDGDAPEDGLRYVRLSDFGRYVWGYAPDYEFKPDTLELPAVCVLDTERLMIETLNADAARVIKSCYGVQVSPGHFTVDRGSFMRKVPDEAALRNKVKTLLTMSLRKELPAVWRDFVTGLKRSFNSVTEERVTDYRLYKVDASDRALVRFILDSPDIRRIVRMAEGDMLLVKKENTALLEQLLSQEGYRIKKQNYFIY